MNGEGMEERIGSEVGVESPGDAVVTLPARDDSHPETLGGWTRFAQARDRILDEYDELFRRLADA